MAGKFHATFIAKDANTMELVFDDVPWQGASELKGVEVEVFERDRSLGGEEDTQDDLLGTVTVDLKQGPNNTHGRPTIEIAHAEFLPPINPARITSGNFDLRAGGATFRVNVFMEDAEWPHDKPPPWAIRARNFVELGLKIRAPGKELYSSLAKKVRPDRLNDLRGPVLTYITRPENAGDVLADNAARFWQSRSDVVVRPSSGTMSLEEIIASIDDQADDLVWEEINIVSHGNLAGLLLPLKANEDVKELTANDVVRLPVRKFSKVKTSSHIVIRGCSIGRDQPLLVALSERLGDAKVFAPLGHLIAYTAFKRGTNAQRFRELLYRRYWAFRPGSNKNASPNTIARVLGEQKATMPLQPRLSFSGLRKNLWVKKDSNFVLAGEVR